jgi:hypothetical protein
MHFHKAFLFKLFSWMNPKDEIRHATHVLAFAMGAIIAVQIYAKNAGLRNCT